MYKELETGTELLFELYLAEKLGKTLGEIRQLPNDEFMAWNMYYARKAQQQAITAGQGLAVNLTAGGDDG